VRLAAIAGECPPPLPEPAAVAVFAGDHGVHAQGVSPWPQEVTAQMVANFLASGAVVNAIAAQAGAEVLVVDVGVAAELPPAPGLLPRKIRPGTADMTAGPAMTREEAAAAVETGIETARDLVTAGNRCLLTGDMGIANTTASAALIAVFTGADPEAVTGRGTGIDDETWAHKVDVIRRALALHQPDPADPLGVLAAVGGLEHAALAGFLLGAAAMGVPVVLDGVIACAAACAAVALCPDVAGYLIAGHRSAEPGASRALEALKLRPLLELDLRLGEGSGAVLALPIVQAAARVLRDVATFDSAGVSASTAEPAAPLQARVAAPTPEPEPAASPQPPGSGSIAQSPASIEAKSAFDPEVAEPEFAPTSAGRRVLVLGGARSGKSVTAEAFLAGEGEVEYVATGAVPTPDDPEWAARVAEHRRRRPSHWHTTETTDLERALSSVGPTPLLVDCLSLWLARVMDDCGAWDDEDPRADREGAAQDGAAQRVAARIDGLLRAWQASPRHVVAVSNEVGSGVVPGTSSGRRYRDELGRLNARLAAASDEVWLCTAGIARRLR
jgi:nicotinate-nucleotide--dimethylbenzimidazole phosphoribosyltransferase